MQNETLDIILAHTQARLWAAQRVPGRPYIEVHFDVGWTQWVAYIKVDEEGAVIVRSLFPRAIPENRRSSVGEYLTRANFGLRVGNWEMDWDDGEARFKTSFELHGTSLSERMLEALLNANTMGYQHYLRGLEAVIDGTLSPSEAISEAEF